MATFVLVHGGWVGGWSWRKLRPLLAAEGHEVCTPTLTGQGERSHLLHEGITLLTHIEDVCNVIKYEDLRDVILVGHSYGGMVIAGVADRLPDRIRRVVFLDAFVPSDGDSVYSLGFPRPAVTGECGAILVPERLLAPEPEDEWTRDLLTPSPNTGDDAISLNIEIEAQPFSRTYVKAIGDAPPPERGGNPAFWRVADRVRDDPRWNYHEIQTTHGHLVLRPSAELANILLGVAMTIKDMINYGRR